MYNLNAPACIQKENQKTGSTRSQRTLPAPPPAPLIEMHWLSMDGLGIPKVCTDCGYFCQLLTLAITKSDWCGNESTTAGFMGKGFPGWKLLRYHVDIDQCH